MEKPIIATTLSGLFVKSEPWDNAHKLWYEERSRELNDDSIKEWSDRPDYFEGVDIVMKRLYPEMSDEQRTTKAREMFFDSVIKYVEQNPDVKNDNVVDYFKSLKQDYRIALLTTNTKETVDRLLKILNLEDFFDVIETSLPEEKDDKRAVFGRFIQNHGKPLIYIGGGRKDSYDYCAEHEIRRVFANLEGRADLSGVESVHNLEELKEIIDSL